MAIIYSLVVSRSIISVARCLIADWRWHDGSEHLTLAAKAFDFFDLKAAAL